MAELGDRLLGDAERPVRETHAHDLDDEPSTSNKEGATVLQAVFNLVNIYVGLGLLSQAYALRLSGWLGLVALALTSLIFCISGKLLVRAFQRLPPGTPHTYPNLGVAALGTAGKYVVAAFTVFEFFSGSCITLLVIWQQLVGLLPDDVILGSSPFQAAVFISFVCVLPILFVPSFKNLSWLNLLGCLSTVVVTLTMLASVALDPQRTKMPVQPPSGHDLLLPGIFQGIGIFALSVSGHSSLPVLRSSMKRPQDFDRVLNLGFGSMLVLYGVVAGCGYLYWGRGAHELVTLDLQLDSPLSGVSLLVPGLTLDRLVSACILVNALTTYPSLLMVIQDMVFSVTPLAGFRGGPGQYLLGAAARVATFFAGLLISYLAYSALGNIMSLSGGFCSISCSLLVPSLFYLLLRRRRLGAGRAALVGALLALGLALLLLITVQNVADIARKHEAPVPADALSALLQTRFQK